MGCVIRRIGKLMRPAQAGTRGGLCVSHDPPRTLFSKRHRMKKKVYLAIGIAGALNAIAQNPLGLILQAMFGPTGFVLGDMFSGTALIFLFLAWYVYSNEKRQKSQP